MRIADEDPQRPWDAGGVYRVVEGVHRIPLPMPGDGLRAVNCYVLEHDQVLTLIDPGVHVEVSRTALRAGLAALGAHESNVGTILVTHIHYDHYSQAVALRADHGVPVQLGRGEERSLELMRGTDRSYPAQPLLLARYGAAALAERLAESRSDAATLALLREGPDRWLDDDTTIDLCAGRLHAVHTPGHTRGHVVFHDEERGLLYAGDHVLPTITPSIGFEPAVPPSPLGSYLRSLCDVRARSDARLLPAHGGVGRRVHERVDELLAHHDDRLAACEQTVAAGWSSAAEIAGQLPWTRRDRRFKELDPFNQTLAVLETGFHLDLLVARGALAVRTVDGVSRFELD